MLLKIEERNYFTETLTVFSMELGKLVYEKVNNIQGVENVHGQEQENLMKINHKVTRLSDLCENN